MHKLISELTRLYLFEEQQHYVDAQGGTQPLMPAVLARHLSGEQTVAVRLVSEGGLTRALVLEFGGKGGGEAHWSALCMIANAVQHELDLPAPAVSISGTAFQLWLSLATPVPVAQARQFVQLLRSTFLPASTDILAAAPPADVEQVALPPCLQPSGKWAAFIHPSMGAAFVDEPGLDMAPPPAAQLGFLESLRSINAAQFAQALAKLQGHTGLLDAVPAPVAAPFPAVMSQPLAQPGLLLQDATLEDIVRWLHARNIEPTLRHRLP
ncbi:TOTE conflict system archaeo-eukaryotic primase domain-containing protein [Janthinobacterium sp. RB2P8]|uniref:TOTE conflict system archaeo-eukaryotic primase domain-containing protein n=1 Tax=Janthinobacterium sp. RB2P8 TaxID=3424191 RepID=UPI003F1F8993